VDGVGAIQSIATSGGQNDSGMFEPNLRDERYLPFEGAGAVSKWSLQLPAVYPSFDRDTISDVILHVRYTAREGSPEFRRSAENAIEAAASAINVPVGAPGLVRVFSIRHEFPNEWYRFLHPLDESGDPTLRLTLSRDRFPYVLNQKGITLDRMELIAKRGDGATYGVLDLALTLEPDGPPRAAGDPGPVEMAVTDWLGLLTASAAVTAGNHPGAAGPTWNVGAWRRGANGRVRLTSESLKDLWVACHYSIGPHA
jgi:hypothetical protein